MSSCIAGDVLPCTYLGSKVPTLGSTGVDAGSTRSAEYLGIPTVALTLPKDSTIFQICLRGVSTVGFLIRIASDGLRKKGEIDWDRQSRQGRQV